MPALSPSLGIGRRRQDDDCRQCDHDGSHSSHHRGQSRPSIGPYRFLWPEIGRCNQPSGDALS
jgi:hypothetical protein